jgi:hypothetical protein
MQEYLGVLIGIAGYHRVAFRVEGDADPLGLEALFDERNRLPDNLISAENRLFLIAPEEVPEGIDSPGHVLDQLHGFASILLKKLPAELARIIEERHLLDDQSERVQRLTPLVDDIADHLNHGGVAALNHQHLVLSVQFFHIAGNAHFQGLVELRKRPAFFGKRMLQFIPGLHDLSVLHLQLDLPDFKFMEEPLRPFPCPRMMRFL